MADQMIFKRFEIKYMIDEAVFEKLMDGYMIADEHGRSTVCIFLKKHLFGFLFRKCWIFKLA